MTQTEWRKPNKRDLIAAHKSASERFGSCVYLLRTVVDEMLRQDRVSVDGRSKDRAISDEQREATEAFERNTFLPVP